MKIGDKVRVKAKSMKGKNRIHEHGEVWIVKKIWGTSVLLREDNNTKSHHLQGLRWVDGADDPDFEIIGVIDDEV